MAIVVKDKNKDLLKEVGKNKPLDGIKTTPKPSTKVEKTDKAKKVGFLKSTLEELKKVDWPGFQKTINWSVIVIIFTFLISVTLGLVDHIFSASINFVDCTSPQGRGNSTTLEECGLDLANELTFRN